VAGNARLDTSHSPAQIRVTGDWTLAHYADLKRLSEKLEGQYDDSTHIDLNGLGALDTAGASLLVELLGSERLGDPPNTPIAPSPPPTARCCKPSIAR
jgi:phospholipid/cholesterol/gamma-HCH transport system permease protein